MQISSRAALHPFLLLLTLYESVVYNTLPFSQEWFEIVHDDTSFSFCEDHLLLFRGK